MRELSKAENIVRRSTQYYHYKQQISTLSKLEGIDNQFQDRHSARKRNSVVKLGRNLDKLDPFKGGLLKVGGRFGNATNPYAIKHPFIMPKKSHVTVLLIRQFHHGKQRSYMGSYS